MVAYYPATSAVAFVTTRSSPRATLRFLHEKEHEMDNIQPRREDFPEEVEERRIDIPLPHGEAERKYAGTVIRATPKVGLP